MMIHIQQIPKMLFLSSAILLSSACHSQRENPPHNDKNTPAQEDHVQMNAIFNIIQANDPALLTAHLQKFPTALESLNSRRETPLMQALYLERLQLAELLIAAGADVNAQDDLQNTPFLYAGAEGNTAIVALALEHGAKFDRYNRYAGTALIPAAEKGHLDTVKLLANTPDYPINHVNRLGWTALMEAIVLSDGGETHVQIVKLLLDAGADANLPDHQGITPLQHAKQRNQSAMVKLLQSHGAY